MAILLITKYALLEFSSYYMYPKRQKKARMTAKELRYI